MTRRRATLAAAVGLAAWCGGLVGPADAYVNPNFTPVHVFNQYDVICAVAVAGQIPDDAKAVTFTVAEVIKGKLSARQVRMDLSDALSAKDGPEAAKDLIATLREWGGRPGLMFLPGKDAQAPNVLLHFDVHWLRAAAGATDDRIAFVKRDTWLNGTFNGSTDMLAATMRFLEKFPGRPMMPVDAGVRWDTHTKVGQFPDKAAAAMLKVLDVNGDGRPDIYAACPAGDRVFLAGEKNTFAELPDLAAASVAADWADFDGDGRADLASLDSAGRLIVYLQSAPGKFRPVPVELPFKANLASPSVHAVDRGGTGRPDLVIGTEGWPIIMLNAGQGKFKLEVPPATTQPDWTPLGTPGPCVIADFDGDGWLDILQIYARGSLMLRGHGNGVLVPAAAAMGDVKQRTACLADLTGDGRPCLLLAGGGAKPVAYVFADGRFESITRCMGEPSYIIQTGASCIAAGDVNNDTFVDLFVGYASESAQCFFNRGYRSLAVCEPLKLPAEEIDGVNDGQTAAVLADLDGDGSLELVTALANGGVWASMTSLGAMSQPRAVCVKLAPGCKYAGPLAVSFWADGICLGGRTVENRFTAATMGLPVAGEVLVKWRLPGGPEASVKVKVLDAPVTVEIGKRESSP